VTTVIMERPNARNAVDPETADALVAAFEAFNRDPEAKVGVFFGSHGTFCAGWDLKYGASLAGQDVRRTLGLDFPPGAPERGAGAPLAGMGPRRRPSAAARGAPSSAPGSHLPPPAAGTAPPSAAAAPPPRGPMGPSRLELDKPVIAAVAGAAVAGGMELALWCDMRVMEEDAFFGVYCRRWGVPLIDGGTVRLPRIVGMGRAMDLILTGRKVGAEEAHRIGLCERVVPRGKARAAAEELAREIARFPQGAVRCDRRSAYETHGLAVREALKLEWLNGVPVMAEAVQGAATFASGKGRHGSFSDI
jgi:enoyl-CoA hydratase